MLPVRQRSPSPGSESSAMTIPTSVGNHSSPGTVLRQPCSLQPTLSGTPRVCRVRSVSGSALSHLAAPPRGILRQNGLHSLQKSPFPSCAAIPAKANESPGRGSWSLFSLAHHQRNDLGSSNHTCEAMKGAGSTGQRGQSLRCLPDVRGGERSQVVLAGPIVQPPHLLSWNRSTLDRTHSEERLWKIHTAIFPGVFLQLNLKRNTSLRHLLSAGTLSNCCAEFSECNGYNNNKK